MSANEHSEHEFFHKVDEKLWRQLRDKLASGQRRQALADVTVISEPAVLDELIDLGISSETIFAFSLFP